MTSALTASTTPISVIDRSSLNFLLERLDASILECQSQVEWTLHSVMPSAQRYSESIDVLSSDVASIQVDIATLQSHLKEPKSCGLEQLHSVDLDLATAQRHLDLFKDACNILESTLAVKSHLVQFDASVSHGHLDIAADAISRASALRNSISEQILKAHARSLQLSGTGKISQKEISMTEENSALKEVVTDQIGSRQVDLKRILRRLVDHLFCVCPNGIEVVAALERHPQYTQGPLEPHGTNSDTQHTMEWPISHHGPGALSMTGETLEQLWHALKGTGCLESELQALATSLYHAIIAPLIAAAPNVPIGKVLVANTLTPGSSLSPRLLWTWFESNERRQKGIEEEAIVDGTRAAAVQAPLSQTGRSTLLVLPILGSLFDFIAAHFFPGHPEAIEKLGSLLYADLTQGLINQFGAGAVEECVLTKLKEFETKLRGLHIIPFDTNTLATFANKHDRLLFESKQTQMLATVRRLCLTIDPAVVLVGEQSADDTLIKCLEEVVQCTSSESIDALCTRLHYQYRLSPLLLPKCYVSRAAYETVKMVDALLDDVFSRIKHQNIDSGLFHSAVDSIHQTVESLALLCSSIHRTRLQTDPMCGAVFFSDCLYVSRRILLLLASVGKQIPPCVEPMQAKLTLVHLVSTLHSVQERIFDNMLEYQRQKILALGSNFNNLSNVAMDWHYANVEGQIGEIVRFLSNLVSCWVDVLPRSVSSKCLGRLLDAFLNCLLNEICLKIPNSDATSSDKQALAYLLSSTRDQLRPVIDSFLASESEVESVTGCQETIVRHSTLWRPFCLFRDLLEADVLEFVAKKREINESLTVQQVQTILIINERKSRSNQEILQMLAS